MAYLIKIYDHATGEEVEREMTADEQAIRDKEVSDWLEIQAGKKQVAQIAQAAKAAAEAKLAALGLTTDDLKALGLGASQ